MYNVRIKGTTDKKLIAYIERVYNYLGLYEYHDCDFAIDFSPRCAANAGGFCNGDDEEVFVEIARSDAVGRIPMQSVKVNIAHELIHAQQIASGRLINKGFVFRNDTIPHTLTTKQIFDGQEYIGVSYEDQPWEIEAYANEDQVYEACK